MAATTYKTSLEIKASTPDRNYRVTKQVESEASPIEMEIDVPKQTTDKEVSIQIDADKILLLLLIADLALTIETNSGSVPDNTIELGGVNELFYDWTEDDPDACLITVDVTKIFLTNASDTDDAVLKILVAQDVTP